MSWEYNNYLAHHGIKGQKWGVRRYQNEDGSPKNGLNLWQRLTHDKKERIRQEAIKKNKEKQREQEDEKKGVDSYTERLRKEKGEDWRDNVALNEHESKIIQRRINAWKRREKDLMNMDVDKISVRELRKRTKLDYWRDRAIPTGYN